jgi:hypothetical protein
MKNLVLEGNQNKHKEIKCHMTSDVLELIHMVICGPFPSVSWNGQQSFIKFIDEFSQYGYIYLIYEESQTLDMFKAYKTEIENQLSKRIH